tara:strand:- start:53 stop:670 length:618 start_codon:yes stop_codon:yes gene_type:complete
MKKYSVLLSDYDGTIMDTRNGIVEGLMQTIRKHGKICSREIIEAAVNTGANIDDVIKISTSLPASVRVGIIDSYRKLYNSGFGLKYSYPYPHTIDFLKKMHSLGSILVVVSNKGQKALDEGIKKSGLHGIISHTFGEGATIHKKPSRLVFDEIKKVITISGGSGIVIGDTVVDEKFARNIGYDFGFASYGYGDRGHFSKEPELIL